MGLAPYFQRSAVAAAQALSGFDEDAIRRRLEGKMIGLQWGADAQSGSEGGPLLDMAVRLLARLYPRLSLRGPERDRLAQLALRINSEIELSDEDADVVVVCGMQAPVLGSSSPTIVYAGCAGWDARLSATDPQPIGGSDNPAGAGAAACLAAANVFRAVFLDSPELDAEITFSTLNLVPGPSREQAAVTGLEVSTDTALVGLGAVGNGVAWLLGQMPLRGSIHLVDHESIDLGNLQRYVLAGESDVGREKVSLAADHFAGDLEAVTHAEPWAQFVSKAGYDWQQVLVALDSAGDRRAVQASLPRWIGNAWTQPGDLGVSTHDWREGACLRCLYLPEGETPSEDGLIAAALGLDDDQHRHQVRELLHTNAPPPQLLLQEAGSALGISPESILPYASRPIRDLYTEGICGGALLPLDRVGQPHRAVHVPLSHQSALAGVLLGTRLVAAQLDLLPEGASVTRLNLLKAFPSMPTQPASKDRRGLCICQDSIYMAAFAEKFPDA